MSMRTRSVSLRMLETIPARGLFPRKALFSMALSRPVFRFALSASSPTRFIWVSSLAEASADPFWAALRLSDALASECSAVVRLDVASAARCRTTSSRSSAAAICDALAREFSRISCSFSSATRTSPSALDSAAEAVAILAFAAVTSFSACSTDLLYFATSASSPAVSSENAEAIPLPILEPAARAAFSAAGPNTLEIFAWVPVKTGSTSTSAMPTTGMGYLYL